MAITVAEKLIEQTGVIGEKIEIGGFKRIEAHLMLDAYIHVGNKIASIVGLNKAPVDKADVLGKDLAMQAACNGSNYIYLIKILMLNL